MTTRTFTIDRRLPAAWCFSLQKIGVPRPANGFYFGVGCFPDSSTGRATSQDS